MSSVEVQFATAVGDLPTPEQISAWVEHALPVAKRASEINIRVVDEAEAVELNQQFRGKDYAPNVLSFPAELPPGMDFEMLGDIALCAPVAVREAKTQQKSVEQHFAHLLIHGTLHLLGFDHESEDDAKVMEQAERELLAHFGFPDPYIVTDGGIDTMHTDHT